jgi:RND family efflux transporter MFP subunit
MSRPPLLLVLAAAAAACGRGAPPPAAAAPPAAATPSAPPALAARLVEPEPVRHAARVLATGTLKARQSAALAMTVPGTLARVTVRRGDAVREGALLAVLDAGAATASRKQAEAAVAAARAQLALAEDAFARATRIHGEDGVSEAQLVQTRSGRDLGRAQLAAAEAQLEAARVHLDHHFLRAPFEGVVTRVPDGVGIAVSPGVPVVTLVTTRALVLETSLTQEEAAGLRAGTPVTVSVPSTGARSDAAAVSVVVPAVDPATNRVPIEISVPNGDGRFLPNAFARAELPRGPEREAWRVPSGALAQREGGFAVWTAAADGRARALPVRVLAEEGERAVVVPADGRFSEDVRVVLAPPLGLSEGAVVAEAAR